MENGIWKCSCGQDNDGKFCINCGSMKPEGAENAIGAPAPVAPAAAPVEAAAPAAVAPVEPAPAAPAVEPIAAVEPVAEPAVPAAEPVAPAVAPIEAAAPAEPAPAAPVVAPIAPAAPVEAAPIAPVAAAAAVAAVTPDAEPVQVIKCQPMPEAPMEDYASVPADPEFAEAEAVPVQPAYQPAPVAAPVPVEPVPAAAPKQVGPVNYQNTASNPYTEPDRASHNPYAPAPVAQPQQNYGGGYAAPVAAAPANNGTGLLILGIAAVVLAFDVTLGAIICGAIGCSQAKKLRLPDGSYPTGKAKIGAILSKVGLIIGIVTSIIAAIVIIIWIIAIIAAGGYALSH